MNKNKKGFTTKRESQKRNCYFSFANERGEQTRLCGFTLIETLVAITILTIAMVGPLYSAGRSLSIARNAANQLTATQLAQEGIEYVRMMRDNSFLDAYSTNPTTASTVGWTGNFLRSGNLYPWSFKRCFSTYGCTVNTYVVTRDPLADLVQCPTSAPGCVTKATINGSASIFTRSIKGVDISANEKRIISTVTWTYRGTNYTVTTTDHLTPWQ